MPFQRFSELKLSPQIALVVLQLSFPFDSAPSNSPQQRI